jgi:hypothetical protein
MPSIQELLNRSRQELLDLSHLAPTRSDTSQLAQEWGVDYTAAFGVSGPDSVSLESLAEHLQTWVNELESLSEWSKKVGQQVVQLAPRFVAAQDEARQLCQELDLDCGEAFGVAALNGVPLGTLAEGCQRWFVELESLSECFASGAVLISTTACSSVNHRVRVPPSSFR